MGEYEQEFEVLNFGERSVIMQELSRIYAKLMASKRESAWHQARQLLTESFKLFQGQEADPYRDMLMDLVQIGIARDDETLEQTEDGLVIETTEEDEHDED
jgi:hypothetical protein